MDTSIVAEVLDGKGPWVALHELFYLTAQKCGWVEICRIHDRLDTKKYRYGLWDSHPRKGSTSIWKGWGCSSENLNFTHKGDQSWWGLRFTWPLQDTTNIRNDSHCNVFNCCFSECTLKDTLMAKNSCVLPWTFQLRPTSLICTLEHSCPPSRNSL